MRKGELFRDLDIAVWLSDERKSFDYTVKVSVELGLQLGIPVDLHVLNNAPLFFKFHVFTKGQPLFSKDEHLRTLIILDRAIREYLDFQLFYEKCKST